jgi:hypothetical protein
LNSFIQRAQKLVCTQYKTSYLPSPSGLKVGISLNVRDGLLPINGLRHPPEGDTTGWYIWAGEDFSSDPNFFKPLHVKHLMDWCPEIIRFLGLPSGWRFLVAGEYEDVWFDDSLLEI